MAYVLIVDDDEDFASEVSTLLRGQGLQTGTETDYRNAIPRIRADHPDAVILDVMFPENDKAGFETARSIRRSFGTLPVLLLTAVNQSFPLGFGPDDLDPTWLPAVDFLEKPVDFALLSAKLSDVLSRHSSARPAR